MRFIILFFIWNIVQTEQLIAVTKSQESFTKLNNKNLVYSIESENLMKAQMDTNIKRLIVLGKEFKNKNWEDQVLKIRDEKRRIKN